MERLRIVLVMEAMLGGTARNLLDLAHEQLRAGHDVAVIYCPQRMEILAREGLEALKPLGLKIFPLPMGAVMGPRLPRILAGYRRIRKHLKADVVHALSAKAGVVVRLAELGGTPVVYTPHALYTMSPHLSRRGRAAFAWTERVMARRTHAIITSANADQTHALEIGLPKDKLHIVVSGLTLGPTGTRAEARRAMGISEETPIVGFAARLAPQKNPIATLQAFKRIKEALPTAELVVVGEGDLRPGLEAYDREHGLNVRWMGLCDAQKIIPGYDVLLLTSDYESFGYVILEALINGVPVVSTPTGVAAELLTEPGAGEMVPFNDPEATAAATLRVLDKLKPGPALFDALAPRLTPFGVETMAKNVEKVYQRAIDLRLHRSRSSKTE